MRIEISRVFPAAAVFAAAAFLLLVSQIGTAHAAVTVNTAASLTQVNQTIKASSSPVAVIGLNLAGSASEAVGSTTVAFLFTASGTTTDFAALGAATSSGVAIYRDDNSAGTQGTFDAEDDVVPLSAAPEWVSVGAGATTTLLFNAAETVLANDTSNNAGNDYFLVIQSAGGAVNGHAFLVQVIPGGVGWNNAADAGPVAAQTNGITVDTVAPTVDSSRTGPMNGSTGVPVSTFIHMGFLENLDQTTLNPNNITFTQGGTAVGAAIRPFPDGFDVISSSPPTYAAGTKFARVTTVSTAFFNIFGTTTIYAQGAYTAPSVGDIVYTQSDTFPPEVGLVTNATMTGGTFAINGNALFRPSQITKFATPRATGAIGATLVGQGDLIVANTTANPTNIRYGWHIVTSTDQNVNSTDLRLDGESAAPSYAASSRFSTIVPTATSTTDTSGRLNATTTLAAGDLVFAKVLTGGDNLGSYAWHLVTTAETINGLLGSGASPGTTTVLRLDSGAAAPHFAPSSVIAKVTTTANGPVDTGAQDATVFSMGDLQFSKATASASNLSAYNFHLISNGATGATSTALRLDNASANLTPSTTYVVTASPGVKDSAGNALAASSTLTFTTGATSATNVTPPAVISSQPQGGSQTFPLGSPIKLTFSVAMRADGGASSATSTSIIKLSTDVNGAPGTQVTATNTWDATTNTITITPAANLATSTSYVVQVTTAAQSSTNTPMPQEYRLYFRTGSAADTTAPTVLGVNPANGQTSIPRSQVFTAGFSEDMNPANITSSTITLTAQIGGAAVVGNVNYSPQSRSASFAPSTLLGAATGYKLTIVSGGSGVKDLSGNALAANYIAYATTTAVADETAPVVSFASADNFGIAITFSETVMTGGGPNAADNVANYTLESPTGTSMSLGGKTVTYDAMTRTARITGLSLTNGNTFKVTVATPVQDLAANGISTAGSPAGNLAYGTVQNSTATGGQLGPGSGTIDQGMQGMNPTRVTPMTRAAGAPSNYKVEFLVGTSIPLGGQIILTFPTGFDLTRATSTVAASSFCNADLNGPATGAPTIASVATTSDTITLTTAGAASGANSFICMDLTGIVNSTVPSSSGYQVDIKTKDTAANNRAILETKTASPFFLGQSGSLTLTVNVFNDGNANSSVDANEGIGNVRVFLFSPAIGGNSTSTNAGGVASFFSLAAGDYMIGLDPGSLASASSTVSINPSPQPFAVSAANLTKNFIVSGGGSTISISGTVTGPAGTSVDVFAGSASGFARTTLALTGNADEYSLRVSPNDTYKVGVGPAMPEAHFTPGAPPPPPPTFTFMPPPPLSVTVGTTSVTGKNFTLSAANKTITGSVLDSSGSGVSNAGVFARPMSNSTVGGTEVGFGTGGQTNTSGAFSLSTVPGTYLVGVFKPGMPTVSEQQITVPATGGNTPASLTFKLDAGTSLTISGTVKDDSGNAVPYAGVGGRKVVSTSNTTPVGGNSGNFVGGPTDANGAYTLYVDAGTWVIEAFAPGFGRLGTKTVTISSSSLTGQDFSAQTLSMGTITGTTTKDSVVQQGVMVRAEGGSGGNMGVSDASGVYTLKVPAGSYTVSCFFPGVGEGTPLTGVTVTADTTSYNNNCTLAAPITITVRLTDGTSPITNAFVDVKDSSGRGNGTNVSATSTTHATYTVNVPPGTYTVRAGHPAYGMIGSTGSVSSTQTITYTTTAGALYAVTGTVTVGGTGVNGAWVSIFGTPTGQSNTVQIGGQTDANGAFSVNVPAGSYRIRINKPGYISPPASTLNVTGAVSVGTTDLSAAGQTISGTVTLDGNPVSGAFVDAASGGDGFAVAQTDSAGAYSLSVGNGTWALRAHSMGYEGGPTTVTVSGNNPSGQTITLSAISGFTVTAEKQETVTPTAGGMFTNSDIGSSFKLNIPANALGTGSNSGTVKTQSNSAVPNTVNGTVLSKNAVTISAVDSSGQPVKNLNDEATVVIPYTEADIPTGKSEADLQLGVWNDATQSYDMLSTTVDTTANTLTAVVSHFSDFAPIVTGSTNATAVAAAAPAATPAAASSGGGGGGTAPVPAARAQIVYPDGRIVYVDQMAGESAAAPVSAKAAAAATGGKAPAAVSASFKALLAQGSRGNDVARLQKLLGVESTGYFGVLTRAAVEQFQIKHGIAKKGEAGFGTLGPKTRAKVAEAFGTGVAAPSASVQGQTQSANAATAPGTMAILAGGKFVRALNVRATGSDVRTLQQILNSDPDTSVAANGAGSSGNETTYFGPATLKAVQKFQEKHNIAALGDAGYGNVGPKTRAKLSEILSALNSKKSTTPESSAPAAPSSTDSTPSTGSGQDGSPQASSGQSGSGQAQTATTTSAAAAATSTPAATTATSTDSTSSTTSTSSPQAAAVTVSATTTSTGSGQATTTTTPSY